MLAVLQVAVFLGVPGLVLWGCARSRVLDAISPVVLCYVLGIAFGNVAGLDRIGVDGTMAAGDFSPAEKTTNLIGGLAVILALGLLVVSTDFKRWLRLAPVTLLASVLAMISAVVVSASAALALRGASDELWQVAGMLVGVYTGGTVNLAAIARALEVDPVTWGVVHTSDVVVCGGWFLVLLAVGPWLFGKFLRPFEAAQGPAEATVEAGPVGPLDVVKSLGVGLLVAAGPLVASQLVAPLAPSLEEPVAILGVTTVAIGLSFIGPLRRVPGLFATGDYLLLVFCVAIGSLATWGRLTQAEPFLFLFTAVVVVGAVAVHTALCALFRVDRDTTIITSVAALFGPPFIPPVAKALGNKEIVVSGVTSGLVGLAAGNYLGLMVAYGVRWAGGFP
jgi:uncharacterized membrane protein